MNTNSDKDLNNSIENDENSRSTSTSNSTSSHFIHNQVASSSSNATQTHTTMHTRSTSTYSQNKSIAGLNKRPRIPQSTGDLVNHRLFRNRIRPSVGNTGEFDYALSSFPSHHRPWIDTLTKSMDFNRFDERENVTVPDESNLPKEASLFDSFDVTSEYGEGELEGIVRRSRAETIYSKYNTNNNTLPTIQEALSDGEDLQGIVLESQIEEKLLRSSVSQTIFNSVNLFIGVGLLSLPYTFRTGGWIFGIFWILFGAVLSRYMLRILLKSMDAVGASTYSDLGEITFGKYGRWIVTSVLFAELFSCGCAYVVLVGDTLHDIFRSYGLVYDKSLLKTLSFLAVMLPTTVIGSLRFLSFGSFIGIIGSLMLGIVMFVDAFSKPEAPGSIWEPAVTEPLPETLRMWLMMPVSLGLVMYNYSGGAVIPNLYRDMEEPEKVWRALNITFLIVTVWFLIMSALGYWMFGIATMEQIIFNISLEPFYSKVLTNILLWLIVLNPLTKFALLLTPVSKNLELSLIRPLFVKYQSIRRLGDEDIEPLLAGGPSSSSISIAKYYKAACFLMRAFIATLAFLVGVYYPNFNDILAFIGTFFSFSVSAIFPCLVYLKIFNGQLFIYERIIIWSILLLSILMVLAGIIWQPILDVIAPPS